MFVAVLLSGSGSAPGQTPASPQGVPDAGGAPPLGGRVHGKAGGLFETGRIALRLSPGERIDELSRDFGLTVLRQVPYSPETYVVGAAGQDADELADRLRASGRVVFAVHQVARRAHLRHLPDDPAFAAQWHLLNSGQGGGRAGEDIRVVGAWDFADGAGSVIALIDDGLDTAHADLAANVRTDLSYDYNDDDPDPTPLCQQAHGTWVAGVAGAVQDNSLGISGVAPGAGLAAIRLLAAPFTDEQLGDALSHDLDAIAIYNSSWGPRDDGRTLEGPGPLALAALQFGIRTGRGGLGAIYVWAAGNGGQRDDNANFDGFVNSRYTIGVSATNNLGTAAPYSEPGACILVNAPSSGGTLGVYTTDISGPCGALPGDYYDDMGGTSAAAPMVAGVVALMLEANPALSWRDVQHILIRSARRNDPDDPDWTLNGAGLAVHHRYGFGRVDAQAALELAAVWDAVIPTGLPTVSFGSLPQIGSTPIPDDDPQGVQASLPVPDRFTVEHVTVTVDIRHPRRGDLEIVLVSPLGTESVLASPRPADARADLTWTLTSVRHWNELASGTWRLIVRDRAPGMVGTLRSWRLAIDGRHLDLPRGDMNGDGRFDSADIAPFLLALLDAGAYRAAYPGLDRVYLGDFDGDGVLNALDAQGFTRGLFR